MPETLLNSNTNNQSNQQPPPPECNNCGLCMVGCGIIVIMFFSGIGAIRYFAEVTPDQYYFPCNNSDIIPSSEITLLEKEKLAYEKIINEYERSSSNKHSLSAELRNIKLKKKDVEKKIDLQNCYRQKCAKINIDNNLEAIKDKALNISTWLFRIGAVLLLLIAIICYYKRNLIDCGFGFLVFICIAPIFINAFMSLYDYFAMQNFEVKC